MPNLGWAGAARDTSAKINHDIAAKPYFGRRIFSLTIVRYSDISDTLVLLAMSRLTLASVGRCSLGSIGSERILASPHPDLDSVPQWL